MCTCWHDNICVYSLITFLCFPSSSSSPAGPDTTPILIFSFKKKEAPDLLLVTDQRGRITSMTAALGHVVGHDAASLVGSNVNFSTLLPQPWAQLTFPQWLKDATHQGSNRSKSGAIDSSSAAMASAGQVVQLLTSTKKLVLARIRLTAQQEDDTASLVMVVHKMSVEAAQDLRRLRLQVSLCQPAAMGVLHGVSCLEYMLCFTQVQLGGRAELHVGWQEDHEALMREASFGWARRLQPASGLSRPSMVWAYTTGATDDALGLVQCRATNVEIDSLKTWPFVINEIRLCFGCSGYKHALESECGPLMLHVRPCQPSSQNHARTVC